MAFPDSPIVLNTLQDCHDVGLNPFAMKLLVESARRIAESGELGKYTMDAGCGVLITIEIGTHTDPKPGGSHGSQGR